MEWKETEEEYIRKLSINRNTSIKNKIEQEMQINERYKGNNKRSEYEGN